MNITNRTSFVGFLIAVSTLTVPGIAAAHPNAGATESSSTPAPTLEARISRLSAALQARAEQLPPEARADANHLLAVGFADGSGRGWADTARGGWADGHGGSFVNRNPWRNGWGDGGGFANWRNY